MKTVLNFIDGKWVESESRAWRERENPADSREIIAKVTQSVKEDVEKAVEAASKAFEKWRNKPAPRRGEILFRAGEILKNRKEELARIITLEMGKVIVEARGDVQEAIDMCYYMAGEGRRLFGETTPSELPDKDIKTIREPLGVVAAITPWNFPVAIPSWKILPALICGNTVVLKPSSYTSYSASVFIECLNEAGVPPGVVNQVNGGGEIGEILVKQRGIQAVSFTGSTEVGFKIEKLSVERHIPFMCEMGGKNAIIVLEDADIDLAVNGAVWGGYGTAGQRCTAASRLIVQERIFEKFKEKLVNEVKKLKIGSGLDENVNIGPLVSESQRKRVHNYTQIGVGEGAKLITGGKYYTGNGCENGYFYEPTLFENVTPDMRIAQEEIFGPVVALIQCEDFKDALEIANGTNYGLSLAIYTRDINKAAIAEKELQSTIVYINAPTIGAEIHAPFGGIKNTGLLHKEAGGRGGAIDFYSRVKVVYRDYSGRLQRAQIDK
ncbi:MAG: aldehyde dehydrogenase family protein [Candidatus Odinarchaeum yellowstonii]|uniref:Aldehyde dehydrogenase family protein n=1 Tax=Odinarchaeota yellowstonii (strain LCB_4) TaxID=1841599 RepID=A0AAF0D3H3_ODILC|nr:MAG: aldehyde dehydrogenase family protein [Candidatus Odinarchaeum yellowstonii]